MAEILRRDPRVQILNDVVLNQVLVRFGNDDDLTRAVIAGVQEEGTCWLGGTTWQTLAAMRISFSNWPPARGRYAQWGGDPEGAGGEDGDGGRVAFWCQAAFADARNRGVDRRMILSLYAQCASVSPWRLR